MLYYINKIPNEHKCGFIALLTVIIIGAAALILAYGAAMLGLGALEAGYVEQRGQGAFAAADGCMEEALRHLRLDPAYCSISCSTFSFTGGNPTCTISIIDLGGGQRQITGTGSVTAGSENYRKTIRMSVTIGAGNRITVNSWQEISL